MPVVFWHSGRSRRRTVIAVIPVILAASVLALIAAAGPAQAASLVDAAPSSGAQLRSSPGAVELSFDHMVRRWSSDVQVSGPDGRADSGRAQAFGHSIRQDLRSDLPDGSYTVSWRADFRHEGQLSGSYGFTIRHLVAKREPTPAATERTSKPASAQTSASVSAQASAQPVASADPVLAAGSLPDTSATVAAPVVKGVAATGSGHLPSPVVLWSLILLLCVISVLINRWRQSRTPLRSPGGPASGRVPRGQTERRKAAPRGPI